MALLQPKIANIQGFQVPLVDEESFVEFSQQIDFVASRVGGIARQSGGEWSILVNGYSVPAGHWIVLDADGNFDGAYSPEQFANHYVVLKDD